MMIGVKGNRHDLPKRYHKASNNCAKTANHRSDEERTTLKRDAGASARRRADCGIAGATCWCHCTIRDQQRARTKGLHFRIGSVRRQSVAAVAGADRDLEFAEPQASSLIPSISVGSCTAKLAPRACVHATPCRIVALLCVAVPVTALPAQSGGTFTVEEYFGIKSSNK